MKFLTGVFAGAIFGLGLILGQMTDPSRVRGFLDVFGQWDPRLGLVMVGAIAVHAPFVLWTRRRGKSLFSGPLQLPRETEVNRRLLIGAGLFGIGWGLAGYCPGPAIVAASTNRSALLLVLSMALGMWLHDYFAATQARLARMRSSASSNNALRQPKLSRTC